jgi:hypothetical protein
MLSRLHTFGGFLFIALCLAAPASADFFLWEMVVGVGRDIKTRNCWPDQYVPISTAEARAPTCIMVSNGWRLQNLLGEYHFQQGTGQLTEAGKEKLRWTLTICPVQHRVIYVHVANTAAETAARVAAVQQAALTIVPNVLPPILTTTISDDGWPADQVTIIARKYQATMPAPRLPSSDGTGGGAGAAAAK